MSEYNSNFTGPEIDAALSRAAAGGAIDQALALKAPLASPALTGTPTINGVAAANVGQLCNPNLLDNWYFGNPVDQRGGYVAPPNAPYYIIGGGDQVGNTTEYTTCRMVVDQGVAYPYITVDGTEYVCPPEVAVRGYTGAGYGIDRWKFFEPGATLLIVDGGVRIIRPQSNVAWGTVVENYQRFAGKQVTLSFLFDKGLYSKSFMIPKVKPQGEFYPDYANAGTEIGHICIGIRDGLDGIAAFFNSDGATVSEVTPIAAKLELGTQQTLAHHDENGNWVLNEIPDYGEQLARCQRQAEKSCNMETSVGSSETASPIIKKADSKLGFYDPMVFFKVPKRTIPAVKIFSAKTGAEGMAYDETAMQDVAVTPSYVGQNSFTVQHASENLVTGHAYQFYYFATAEL